jgi:exosome complex RNA-binding protein Rrp42 (RNase PH superfamily)
VLGGVKLLVSPPNRAAPSLGLLRLTLDLPQASDATARPGKCVHARASSAAPPYSHHTPPRSRRQSEEALELSHRLSVVLASSAALDLSQLCLIPGRLVWCVAVELICLSRDGSLFDTALAAALGALARTSLPPVSLTPDGRVADTASLSESCGGSALPNAPLGRLRLRSLPAALTCALYRMGDSHRVLCDPSAEEEELAHALVTVAVDEQGRLLEVHKPGSQPGKGARGDCSVQTLLQCCAAATMRRADVAKIFASAGIEVEEATAMLS